jgi:hypothetical protein
VNATTNTKIDAARAMLVDLQDEAAALSQVAEEAISYIDDEAGEGYLAALGTLTGAQANLDAITSAFTAAKALLMRARDGGR